MPLTLSKRDAPISALTFGRQCRDVRTGIQTTVLPGISPPPPLAMGAAVGHMRSSTDTTVRIRTFTSIHVRYILTQPPPRRSFSCSGPRSNSGCNHIVISTQPFDELPLPLVFLQSTPHAFSIHRLICAPATQGQHYQSQTRILNEISTREVVHVARPTALRCRP